MSSVRAIARRGQRRREHYAERARGARDSHQGMRHADWSLGTLAAQLATRITMPANPFGEPQAWEPTRLELRIQPTDLD